MYVKIDPNDPLDTMPAGEFFAGRLKPLEDQGSPATPPIPKKGFI